VAAIIGGGAGSWRAARACVWGRKGRVVHGAASLFQPPQTLQLLLRWTIPIQGIRERGPPNILQRAIGPSRGTSAHRRFCRPSLSKAKALPASPRSSRCVSQLSPFHPPASVTLHLTAARPLPTTPSLALLVPLCLRSSKRAVRLACQCCTGTGTFHDTFHRHSIHLLPRFYVLRLRHSSPHNICHTCQSSVRNNCRQAI
jgi:hypothetical protein